VAALLAAAALSCAGLSESDQAKLEVHQQNARSFFDGGDYQRALHQATSALELAPDDVYMGLVRGHCLLRLGTAARNPSVLDDSVATFEGMLSIHADDDRVSLGAASAHLGRALLLVDEIDRTQQRLDSEFLDATARAPETARLNQQQAARAEHLSRAEELLRNVLEHPLQKDNPIALTDLVLVLHAEDGRDAEALPLANRTLELLDESTEMTRTTMDTNKRLTSAEQLTLQARLDQNKEKEQALRDLLASAALARGDTDGFLAQMSALEARDMLGESQYYSRAGVYEKLGKVDLAISDLETFLKLRTRRFATYADDDMAPKVFERIENLRGQQASPPR
jgi:tetratricopeptide (TPR) repeat protein